MVPLSRLGAGPLLALLVLTAGCLGVLTGDEPLRIESDPVSVTVVAQNEAGYEQVRVTTQVIEREFSAGGQTREVEVTNHIAEYSRSVSLVDLGTGELARFVVLSTPAVEVLGRTYNPVGDMSNRELAEEVQGQYEGLENLQPAGERTVTVLGEDATVSTFTADAELDPSGQSVELTLHVTRVRDGADFIVAIAVHPRALDGEPDRVDSMLAGLRHQSA